MAGIGGRMTKSIRKREAATRDARRVTTRQLDPFDRMVMEYRAAERIGLLVPRPPVIVSWAGRGA